MTNDQSFETDLAFGDFVIDRADERVLGPDGPLRLGHKAYRVLLALAEHEGRLLTKDALFSSVWDGTIVSDSALTSVIKELRRALRDESRTPRYIESVYGRGYRLIAPVRPVQSMARPTATARRVEEAQDPMEGEPPVVLVSAFRDEAVRERHPHVASELREEVLSGLSRFREIQLVADNRDEEEAAQARRHERGYQLTATLLPDGDGAKIIARARRLTDRRVVWAETMALADTGTAGGVEKIVRRIVGAALPAVDEDLLAALPHESDDLYDRYLIAKRRSLTAASFEDAKAAAEALEGIIAERPGFALAYPPLVRLYNTDFGYTGLGSSDREARDHALALAKDGLAADRANVHAYTVLGYCHLWHEQRGPARACFEQALQLNPYNPVRLNEVAGGMVYLGDFEKARALLDMSLHLQSYPSDSFYEDSGRLHLLEGSCERARVELESILSDSIWASLYLALCEIRLGMAGGNRRFDRWRARVESQWHTGVSPTAGELSAWIRRHHPLPGETGEQFFADVEAALHPGEASPEVPRQAS